MKANRNAGILPAPAGETPGLHDSTFDEGTKQQ